MFRQTYLCVKTQIQANLDEILGGGDLFFFFLPSRVVKVGSLEASLRGKSPSHHTTSCHELASSALMNGFHHNVNILLKLTLFLKESKIIVKVGHEKLHQPVQDW